MDPNATLTTMRAMVAALLRRLENEDTDPADMVDDTRGLVDACGALDNWLMKGGALPKSWGRWVK
jgi:hypothetical protein